MLGTVQILERSGIRAPTAPSASEIPVRSERKGVGQNLQDHLQLRLIYKVYIALCYIYSVVIFGFSLYFICIYLYLYHI